MGRMNSLFGLPSSSDEPLLSGASPEDNTNHTGRARFERYDSTLSSVSIDAEKALLQRRVKQSGWRLDRGTGFYAQEREKFQRPCLVQTGRHAGRSRVRVTGLSWQLVLQHKIRRDFFNSAVNAPLNRILGALACLYFLSLFFWSVSYYILWRLDDICFTGFSGYVSAFLFAVETQQTIGYGTRAPGECWATAALISLHSLLAVVLDSLILGIMFARVSHPKNRGRTILVSDCAVIARRDGELKFMFRVADIQRRQVVNPVARAYLFTWGPYGAGRTTAEGELIPVTCQELIVTGMDSTLLLPVTLEHVIDERSPLAGHTQKSLEAVGAEIVVILSATTELGANFNIRRSYLPNEIHWGHVFVPVIEPACDGHTQHSVDIGKFHDVEPQPGLDLVPPHKLADKVMFSGDRGALPARILGGNTLVLSDTGVVAPRNGAILLMFRLGDVYPGGQVRDVNVRAYIYRWQATTTPEGEVQPYTVDELSMHPTQPCLRYPHVLWHNVSDPDSPIAAWTRAEGKRADADAEILVIVQGTCAQTGLPVSRQRVYPVLAGVKWGALFRPVVAAPPPGLPSSRSKLGGAAVDWSSFHSTAPANMDVAIPARQRSMQRSSSLLTSTIAPQLSASGASPADPVSPKPIPGFRADAYSAETEAGTSKQSTQESLYQPQLRTPVSAFAVGDGNSYHSVGSGSSGATDVPRSAAQTDAGDLQPGSLAAWNPATAAMASGGHGIAAAAMAAAARQAGAAVGLPRAPPAAIQRIPSGDGTNRNSFSLPASTNAASDLLANIADVSYSSGSGHGGSAHGGSHNWIPRSGVRPIVRNMSAGQTLGSVSPRAADEAEALPGVLGSDWGTTHALQPPGAAVVQGPGVRTAPGTRRGPSGQVMHSSQAHSSAGSGTASGTTGQVGADDWRSTRSLFAAMEEMAKLAAQENQQHQQQ